MTVDIINASPRYRPAPLIEPPRAGYLLLSAEVDPPHGRRPFPGSSPARDEVIARLPGIVADLEHAPAVQRVTAYRTVLTPPPAGFATSVAPARFDVVVLVETDTPGDIGPVEETHEYLQLRKEIESSAGRLQVMRARCVKCIADVEKSPGGLFLFNHFVAADPYVALDLWDHLAGWFMSETKLDNSTVLQPIDRADFAFVNHARWDHGLPWLAAHLARPSFFSYVRANLDRHQVGVMPILCRMI